MPRADFFFSFGSAGGGVGGAWCSGGGGGLEGGMITPLASRALAAGFLLIGPSSHSTRPFSPFAALVIIGAVDIKGVLAGDVVAGAQTTCAITNHRVGCWGSGLSGAIGRGNTEDWADQPGEMASLVPIPLASPTLNVGQVAISMAGDGDHTCLLFTNNQGVCFGSNLHGECGADSATNPLLGPVNTLTPFNNATENPLKQVISLLTVTCVLSALPAANVTCWGGAAYGTAGRGDLTVVRSLSAASPIVFDHPATTITVTMISGVYWHACALFSNKRVKCWGSNGSGQLGQGHTRTIGQAASDMTSLSFISFADSASEVARVSAGKLHTCVLFSSPIGRIICWGSGLYGQLGTGSTLSKGTSATDMTSMPLIGFSSTDVATDVSAGFSHSCALFDAGAAGKKIRCWGQGGFGQLGTDSGENIGDSPAEVPSLGYISFADSVSAVSVSAGLQHSCGAFINGFIRCWGSGRSGALGIDSTVNVGADAGSMLSLNYTRLFPSSLVSVVPNSGSMAGFETVTVNGVNFFTPTVTVIFANVTPGGCPSPPITLTGIVPVSLTSIVIQTPSWSPCGPGLASLVVLGFSPGYNLTTSPWPFQFFPPGFTLTSIAESSFQGGLISGGTLVIVVGTGLVSTPDAVCKFGTATSPLAVASSTSGSCISPSVTAAQNAPLRIALNGVTFTTSGPTFYYYDVSALALDVPRGPATGVTPIYIRLTSAGTVNHPGYAALVNFSSDSSSVVKLTRQAVIVADPSSPSLFSILTSSPDATPYTISFPASFTITVSLNGGATFLPLSSTFEYYSAPAVTGLSLAGAPADNASGMVVTLLGSNLRSYPLSFCKITTASGASITLPATHEATSGGVLWVTLPSLVGVTPGPAVFEVSLNDGRQYTYDGKSLSVFSVSAVAPAGGPLAGGTPLTVTGAGFIATSMLCKVGGGSPSQANFLSSSAVSCSSSAGLALGAAGVSVSMDAARYSPPTGPAQFIYYGGAVFERLEPASGSFNATALTVTVVGRSFPVLVPAQVRCRFGAVATLANSRSGGAVGCPLPSGQVGKVAVSIAFNGVDFEETGLLFEFVAPSGGVVCQPGYAANSLGVCLACPAGSFSDDGVKACQPCPKGRFAANNSSIGCESCGAGYIAPREGSTGCLPCLSGSYAAANESSACLPCEQGKFAAGNASVACVVCAAGTIAMGQGQSECSPCAPGSFAAKNESSVCVACPPGQYAANSSSTGCDFCPTGKVSRASGSSTCTSCPRGTFSVINLTTSCPDCPVGTYSDVEEASSCKVCPMGTFSVGIPSSVESCVCKPGFYEKDGRAGSECDACPEGGVCSGIDARPVPLTGYWASARSPFAFIRCDPPGACPGGDLDQCAEGYQGRMCSRCEQGWFRAGGECKRCPKGAPGIMFAFVLFSVLIVLLLVKFGGRRSAKAYGGTIGIATKFFQVLAVIGRLDVSWPSSVKETITTLTTPFSLKFDTLGPECSAVSIRYEHKWGITMMLPVFFAAIFAAVFLGAWVMSKMRRNSISISLKNRIVNGYLSLLSLGFLTLATTALEPFGCRLERDRRWTLVADPSRLCFEGWWKQLVPFAAIGIVVYIMGIPLAILWWLRRNRANLTHPDFVERYGCLYSSYSPSLPHWEPVVMMEKVLIAAIGLLLSGFVMLQVMLLQVIFVVTLSLYQSYDPYFRGKDNRLHATLRWTSLLVLVAAALFRADQFPSVSIRRTVEVAALALIALGIIALLGSVLYNLWEIRKMLKTKVSDKLERMLHELASPPGKLAVLRFLSRTKGQWNDRFEAVLAPIKATCDPIDVTKGSRPLDVCDVPVITDDPGSDLIITVFTGGVFADEVVPALREWVSERVLAGVGGEVKSFMECFTAMGKAQRDARISTLASSSTSPIVRESAMRLSAKHLSSGAAGQKRSSTLPVPSTSTTAPTSSYPADTSLRLFTALYGFTPHNPGDIFRAEFLFAAQGVLLAGSPSPSISLLVSEDSFPPTLPPPPSPSQSQQQCAEGFENGIEMTVL